MPVLNWQALSMGDVMTDHFWVYWAVTIPMTILVVAIVGSYGIIQGKFNRRMAETARNEAGYKDV